MASKQIAKARTYFEPEPIFIRPSVQWYATVDQVEKVGFKEAVSDEFGVWHVRYSIHSSREELDWALQLLQPKWVISTTPTYRAMELNYVKKHCYKTCIRPDDPIWKLFKSGSGKSLSSSIPTTLEASRKADARSSEVLKFSMECSITDAKELASDSLELKLESSPSFFKPITLFGRARLGDKFINILDGEKKQCLESTNYMSDLSL
ncbi:hypothetical protein HPP92_012957 [Vanilla planifolia]|uniref:DNA repair metallo-beta-lactamase domain-containing protein n=1 Tax=Vanilla planifolia TaxID=51239 RepID=A0A835UYC4_VANPL|nr:hypothetical protein HPP92_013423 [Vanilla planifolia]KAG0478238.1 hypothetical protein HPP92_012957 [Vanilla planifolia]